MAEITLGKALKIKNRLTGRLAKVQVDIQTFNSVPDGQDRTITDVHVADRNIAEGTVHRDHVAAAQHKVAAPWLCGRVLRACAGWRGEKRRRTGNAERRAPKEKAPATRGNAGIAARASEMLRLACPSHGGTSRLNDLLTG